VTLPCSFSILYLLLLVHILFSSALDERVLLVLSIA
jgi:hypothetical protein